MAIKSRRRRFYRPDLGDRFAVHRDEHAVSLPNAADDRGQFRLRLIQRVSVPHLAKIRNLVRLVNTVLVTAHCDGSRAPYGALIAILVARMLTESAFSESAGPVIACLFACSRYATMSRYSESFKPPGLLSGIVLRMSV